MLGEEAALLRQDTANARGDEQEPNARRRDLQHASLVVIRRKADNTRESPLSILSQPCILGARVRKDACLPREICRVSIRTDRAVRGDYRVAEVSRGHNSRWKRAALE